MKGRLDIPDRESPHVDSRAAGALVVEALRDRLPRNVQVENVTVNYYRPKGREGTVAGLRIDWRDADADSGRTRSQAGFLRWAPLARLTEEAERCKALHTEFARPFPAVTVLEAQECSLQLFPFDRRLIRLGSCLRPRFVARMLEEAGVEWAAGDRGWRIRKRKAVWSLASYRPERRAVLRWDLQAWNDESAEKVARSLVLRTCAGPWGVPSTIYPRLAAAGVPAPALLAEPDEHTRIEEFVEGSAGDLARMPAERTLLRAGISTARWHRKVRPDGLAPSNRRDLVERARLSATTTSRFRPELQPVLEVRLDAAERADVGPDPEVALHGDLHPGQWIDTAHGVVFIDFDRVSRGEAAEDVANLIVHLLGSAGGDAHRGIEAFRRGYEREWRWPSPGRLAWHFAAAQLRLLELAVRRPGAVPETWVDAILSVEALPEVAR